MFGFLSSKGENEKWQLQSRLTALDRSHASIEFEVDGTIITANQNFLTALGYTLQEIKGKHHSIFIEESYKNSPEYTEFWRKLSRGEFQADRYKRIGKGGREVWIEASYDPLLDQRGNTYRVVKYATDITKETMEHADLLGQVNAIGKSQAVIEFNLDGSIITANANFLDALGYTLGEIQGKHHSMFVEPSFRDSPEYAAFWRKLAAGEYQADQYKRIGKGGKAVWIEASYNPILDLNGKPFKVVKFATDVTGQHNSIKNLKRLIDENFETINASIGQAVEHAVHAAGMTSANVQTVASSAEELAASVSEISQSMAKSQQATETASGQVAVAEDSTQRLANAASAMSGIVGMIQNIAGQINLLALNATIESARAGEAGKGFAVVANEVKNLANQAAKATEQITNEIEGIQNISSDVVGALGRIRQSIETLQDHVASTASAVDQQSAVTHSMSENMQGAAGSVATISNNISDISSAVAKAGTAFARTKEAADALAR